MAQQRSNVLRLAGLRRVLEERYSLDLQRASQAVALVDEAMDRHRMSLSAASLTSRSALEMGDRDAWICAEYLRVQTQTRGLQMARLLADRSELREQALAIQRQAKLEYDQALQLLREEQRLRALHDARRAQALADDRYLSRRRWLTSVRANTVAMSD